MNKTSNLEIPTLSRKSRTLHWLLSLWKICLESSVEKESIKGKRKTSPILSDLTSNWIGSPRKRSLFRDKIVVLSKVRSIYNLKFKGRRNPLILYKAAKMNLRIQNLIGWSLRSPKPKKQTRGQLLSNCAKKL